MAEHTEPQPHHADVSHETSDVNIRAILMFGGGLLVMGAVAYFVVWLLFGYLSRRDSTPSASLAFPLAVGQGDRLPPEPRLQANPKQDLRELRESEDAVLKSYGWVDKNGGVVRIPIDEAMKLVLQRGLPSRPASEQQVVK